MHDVMELYEKVDKIESVDDVKDCLRSILLLIADLMMEHAKSEKSSSELVQFLDILANDFSRGVYSLRSRDE